MIKVAAAVIVSDGKILAAKRKNERLGGGFWEFPGGKLEPGETPKQACQRTKLKTYNLKLVAASEYRWLTPEQLASVTWLKPSEPVLEVIKQTDLRKFE